MEQQQPKTWLDIKNFTAGLTDEQLKQPLALEIVDSHVEQNIDFGVTEEDIYMYDSDVEDIGTIKILKECHEDDFDESKCELITPKGSVYMVAD